MKLPYLSVVLVVLTLYRSAGAAPVLDDNDDLRETIKSMQKTIESLQVSFDSGRCGEHLFSYASFRLVQLKFGKAHGF